MSSSDKEKKGRLVEKLGLINDVMDSCVRRLSQTVQWREKKKRIPLEFHRRSVAENPQFPLTANAHKQF